MAQALQIFLKKRSGTSTRPVPEKEGALNLA
jgi:hypothetical protein